MAYVLTTSRLTLRPVTPADHAALLAHWTTPQVREFLFDGAVMTDDEVSGVIADSVRTFAADGYGLWLACSPTLIGTAGLRPLDDLGLEIFYSLAPSAQGRGYATEAAVAVIDHARETLALPAVFAEIDAGNTASHAVVTRLSMTPFATVPGLLGPMTRYRLTFPPQ
ncbi:GNAT family N-acetyltransferase [Nocardia yamanashiensis]|uniref:GNAT family N-acetyltransferase n=1 Tax=Nocardia yamanashiensis TaxID=209247 RepID=UPI000AB3897C|nr:GNAT family N-acetyltransferase [Nocardia yamanashiensis]